MPEMFKKEGENKMPERRVIYYCPECMAEQVLIPNPYYLHICTECDKSYDSRSLKTELKVIE